jgi:hypothetical protein
MLRFAAKGALTWINDIGKAFGKPRCDPTLMALSRQFLSAIRRRCSRVGTRYQSHFGSLTRTVQTAGLKLVAGPAKLLGGQPEIKSAMFISTRLNIQKL